LIRDFATYNDLGVHVIDLVTPHIPLRVPIAEALAFLQRLGTPVQEDSSDKRCLRLETPLFDVAVYDKDGTVGAVWYDDPSGRESDKGRAEKVEAYLKRYGDLQNWELRLDNGWMHYWSNPTDRAQLVYGLHKDVIRINQHSEQSA
jgi:hypothetical protein